MRIVVTPHYEALSRLAAEVLVSALVERRSPLFCLIGGRTPRRAYELFTDRVLSGHLPHDGLRHVQPNEWCDLSPDDPRAFAVAVERQVLGPLAVTANRRIGFDPTAPDRYEECRRVQRELSQQGPIDCLVLGLGPNGHLAFNEPGPTLSPDAHVAELSNDTRAHLLGDEAGDLSDGMTIGMADIMSARRVVLLVSGANKTQALGRMLAKDLTTEFPASLLWTHPRALCICDEAARGGVELPLAG